MLTYMQRFSDALVFVVCVFLTCITCVFAVDVFIFGFLQLLHIIYLFFICSTFPSSYWFRIFGCLLELALFLKLQHVRPNGNILGEVVVDLSLSTTRISLGIGIHIGQFDSVGFMSNTNIQCRCQK